MISSPWFGFILRRFVALFIVLCALVVATFLMLRFIPGDPAIAIGGMNATQGDLERIRREFGLDKPVLEQFLAYVGNLARGELGKSFFFGEKVSALIANRLGVSLQLAGVALGLVLLVAIPFGMLAGAFTREGRHKRGELAFMGVASVMGALPEFLMATFLAFIFAVWLRLLPVAGGQGAAALILPVLSVSIRPIATLSRIVRVETLNVLSSDYIRTARGKRLPWRLIYLRHTMPNVVTAALTVGGLLFSGLIGGAVVVENVFARPGLGTALVAAVLARDYPVVQGTILVLGMTVVVVNTVVDIIVAVVDPRAVQGKL